MILNYLTDYICFCCCFKKAYFEGAIGQVIEEIRNRERRRIVFETKRKERLGPIPDDELKIKPYKDMHLLNPASWKEQDHYAILGIGYLRHRATDSQIKRARKLF